MTTQDLINYYANLLILQYIGKPKAYATIQAWATSALLTQSSLSSPTLALALQDAFDLLYTPANGVQLDTLGKYLGVSRNGNGINGAITLSDSDFLSLIQFATLVNNSGSSLYDIQNAINTVFPGEILVYDYQNMRMSYLISSTIGSQNLVQIAVNEGLLPVPMGVQLASVIYAPIINMFFGFRTYSLPASNSEPFNTYANFNYTWPWLSYNNLLGNNISLGTESGNSIVQENGGYIYLG
jgi:hypothetical protein